MNHIYIGDRQLEPDDEPECEFCDSLGHTDEWDEIDQVWYQVDCHCQYDPDPGEPNEDPE